MKKSRVLSSIEPLEDRIAPAAFAAPVYTPTKVIYTGPDGSLVTVTSSKPILAQSQFTFAASGVSGGEQLQLLDISGITAAIGAAISITATAQKDPNTGLPTGTGFANVGTIDASGIDLASVTVHGDLTQIDVGAPVTVTTKTAGLGSLTVQSMGKYGTSLETSTIAALTTSEVSAIVGGVKTLTVAGDVNGAWIKVSGSTRDGSLGSIGKATIGGSVIGGAQITVPSGSPAVLTGAITATANIGTLTIKGELIGGSGVNSGRIAATKINKNDKIGSVTSITIGEIVGGSGTGSGSIVLTGSAGAVKVLHDVSGGSGASSGRIEVDGALASLSIGGSLNGSNHSNTGEVLITGAAAKIAIAGDINGGSNTNGGTTPPAVTGTGYVEVDGALASITVGGSVISGTISGNGALTNSGAIRSLANIGSVIVGGALLGNSAESVEISAEGLTTAAAALKTPAIAAVSVAGSTSYANILAGYDASDTANNGDVTIGKVSILGDWVASNLIAGFSANSKLIDGTTDSPAPAPTGTTAITSKIASIVIGGQVYGTTSSSTDIFGFEADSIGSFKTGTVVIPVPMGSTITLAAATGSDVIINTATSGH